MFVLHQSKQLRWKGSSLRCIGLLLNRCQYSSSAWLVWICFKLAGILFSFFVGLKTGQTRFQSSETKILSQSDDDLREELLRRLVDHSLLGPTRQIVELQPEVLPQRELPPGNMASLFLLYLGYMRHSGITPAGKSTFYAIGREWKVCLKFRPETEHSMCHTCQKLKAAIHNSTAPILWQVSAFAFYFRRLFYIDLAFIAILSKLNSFCSEDFAVHAKKCDELLQHYSAQWRDREVYWSARDRSSIHGDLLTLIIDSFDRSKLYLPKFPFNRTPKRPAAYQAYHRHLVFSTVNCLMFLGTFFGF